MQPIKSLEVIVPWHKRIRFKISQSWMRGGVGDDPTMKVKIKFSRDSRNNPGNPLVLFKICSSAFWRWFFHQLKWILLRHLHIFRQHIVRYCPELIESAENRRPELFRTADRGNLPSGRWLLRSILATKHGSQVAMVGLPRQADK